MPEHLVLACSPQFTFRTRSPSTQGRRCWGSIYGFVEIVQVPMFLWVTAFCVDKLWVFKTPFQTDLAGLSTTCGYVKIHFPTPLWRRKENKKEKSEKTPGLSRGFLTRERLDVDLEAFRLADTFFLGRDESMLQYHEFLGERERKAC